MKKTSLPEIFAEVTAAETIEAKKQILIDNYSTSTAAVLSLLFNPGIKLNLPAGIPDGFEFGEYPSMSLERAIRSFPSFVNVEQTERLQIAWLRLMRNISKDEAEFAFKIKDHELDIGLTQADVHEIFPTLIPEPSKSAPAKEVVKPVVSKEEVKPDVAKQITPDNAKSGEFPPAEAVILGEPLKIDNEPLPSPVLELPPVPTGDEDVVGEPSEEAKDRLKAAIKAKTKPAARKKA